MASIIGTENRVAGQPQAPFRSPAATDGPEAPSGNDPRRIVQNSGNIAAVQLASEAVGRFNTTIENLGSRVLNATKRCNTWLINGVAYGTGAYLLLSGTSLTVSLVAMVAATIATGVLTSATEAIAKRFDSRVLDIGAVRDFGPVALTGFEQALYGELASYAVNEALGAKALGDEAYVFLQQAIENATYVPEADKASARRVAAVIIEANRTPDDPYDKSSDVRDVLRNLAPDERESANAIIRATLLKLPTSLLSRTQWSTIYDLTKPTFPASPALGPSTIDASSVARWETAFTAFSKAEAAALDENDERRTLRESFVSNVALPAARWGAGIGAFFAPGGGALAAAIAYWIVKTESSEIPDALHAYEIERGRRDPKVDKLATGLDPANPLEQAILAELAKRYLSTLDDTDAGGMKLRDDLHALEDAAATQSPAILADAKAVVDLMTALKTNDVGDAADEFVKLSQETRLALRGVVLKQIIGPDAKETDETAEAAQKILSA